MYASECTRMRLTTPKIIKISWGSMPPDPPGVNNCRAAMFSIVQVMTLPPRMEKVMYGPESCRFVRTMQYSKKARRQPLLMRF